jgi:hypothetical protein
MKLKDLLKEEYGNTGKFRLPKNHKAGMKVPRGGACCANCEYFKYDGESEQNKCTNEFYQKWANTDIIPHRPDEYCTDWYEPKKHSKD